jgi:hypothetical protein
MTWNYRIVRIPLTWAPGGFYELHEVYYDADGKPRFRTTEAPGAGADTRDELLQMLRTMLSDAEKYPVLDDSEIGATHDPA